jgi:hypothetical protein
LQNKLTQQQETLQRLNQARKQQRQQQQHQPQKQQDLNQQSEQEQQQPQLQRLQQPKQQPKSFASSLPSSRAQTPTTSGRSGTRAPSSRPQSAGSHAAPLMFGQTSPGVAKKIPPSQYGKFFEKSMKWKAEAEARIQLEQAKIVPQEVLDLQECSFHPQTNKQRNEVLLHPTNSTTKRKPVTERVYEVLEILGSLARQQGLYLLLLNFFLVTRKTKETRGTKKTQRRTRSQEHVHFYTTGQHPLLSFINMFLPLSLVDMTGINKFFTD